MTNFFITLWLLLHETNKTPHLPTANIKGGTWDPIGRGALQGCGAAVRLSISAMSTGCTEHCKISKFIKAPEKDMKSY